MKKTFLFAAVLTLCATSQSASAQGIGKYFSRPDVGLGVNTYTATSKGTINGASFNDNSNIGQYSLMADVNLPIFEISDHAAVGIMPGLSFGISPSNGESLRNSSQSA